MGVEEEDELAFQERNHAVEAFSSKISDRPAGAVQGKSPVYFSVSPGDSVTSANRTVEASISIDANVSPIAMNRNTSAGRGQGQGQAPVSTLSPSPPLPTTIEAASYPVPAMLEATFDLVANDRPARGPLNQFARSQRVRAVRGEAWPKTHPLRAVSPTATSSSSSMPSSDSEDDEPLPPSMALRAASGYYPLAPSSSVVEASRVRVGGGGAVKGRGEQAEWVRAWGSAWEGAGGCKAVRSHDEARVIRGWPTRGLHPKL